MTFVVLENCINVNIQTASKSAQLIAFTKGQTCLLLTDECIDCTLCEPECPADAIKSEDDLTDDEQRFIKINADLSQKWPVIDEMKHSLPDADEWKGGRKNRLDRTVNFTRYMIEDTSQSALGGVNLKNSILSKKISYLTGWQSTASSLKLRKLDQSKYGCL